MDQPESETTKEAFKVLERYAKKRYEKAQSFLCTNSENFPRLSSFRSFLESITPSRFSFQGDLKHAKSFISADDEELPSDESRWNYQLYLINGENIRSYLWSLIKFLYDRGLKHVLIILTVIAYTLIGALIFYWLEAENENNLREHIRQTINERQERALSEIQALILRGDCVSERCKYRIDDILQSLTETVYINAQGGKEQWNWDYPNSIFFALSIITTIGYGNLSPKTIKGRVATIIYGLFGIPLCLFLLNSIGHVMFSSVEAVWKQMKKKLKRNTRLVRKHIWTNIKSSNKPENGHQFRNNTDITIIEKTTEEEDGDIFETFPIYLAIIIVFIYVFLCSITMCLWESWDYFTAFYFFFVSISTIGFGDEMPEHPRYATCFFIFFIFGLSLVSMCITILQTRVENRYMQALQLIDEQRQMYTRDGLSNSLPQVIVETPDQDIDPVLKSSSRWRHPSAFAINNNEIAANCQSQINSVSECLSPAEYYASPILNALIHRRHGSHSRSLTNTTPNISIDVETPLQSPIKQYSADFLDNAPTRPRPKHLWKKEDSPIQNSKNSLQMPPLAEQDTDSEESRN